MGLWWWLCQPQRQQHGGGGEVPAPTPPSVPPQGVSTASLLPASDGGADDDGDDVQHLIAAPCTADEYGSPLVAAVIAALGEAGVDWRGGAGCGIADLPRAYTVITGLVTALVDELVGCGAVHRCDLPAAFVSGQFRELVGSDGTPYTLPCFVVADGVEKDGLAGLPVAAPSPPAASDPAVAPDVVLAAILANAWAAKPSEYGEPSAAATSGSGDDGGDDGGDDDGTSTVLAVWLVHHVAAFAQVCSPSTFHTEAGGGGAPVKSWSQWRRAELTAATALGMAYQTADNASFACTATGAGGAATVACAWAIALVTPRPGVDDAASTAAVLMRSFCYSCYGECVDGGRRFGVCERVLRKAVTLEKGLLTAARTAAAASTGGGGGDSAGAGAGAGGEGTASGVGAGGGDSVETATVRVARSLRRLGTAYEGQRRSAEAAECYKEAMTLLETTGDQASLVAEMHNCLGSLYSDCGNLVLARRHFLACVDMVRRLVAPGSGSAGGEGPSHLCIALNNLAGVEDSLGHFHRAEPLAAEACMIALRQRAQGGEWHGRAQELMQVLAHMRERMRDPREWKQDCGGSLRSRDGRRGGSSGGGGGGAAGSGLTLASPCPCGAGFALGDCHASKRRGPPKGVAPPAAPAGAGGAAPSVPPAAAVNAGDGSGGGDAKKKKKRKKKRKPKKRGGNSGGAGADAGAGAGGGADAAAE